MAKISDNLGVKSIQTGYATASTTTGTGEDLRYIDITISSVNSAKCVVFVYGGNNTVEGTSWQYTAGRISGRVTSSTNLRIHSGNSGANISARWYVIEYL